MKKLTTALALLFVSCLAHAQFTAGTILTAEALNAEFALFAPLTGATLTGPLSAPTLSVVGASTLGVANIGTANISTAAINSATFTVPVAVSSGGTGSSTASGTALDNITGFSGTGVISRTGAGTYTFGTIPPSGLSAQAANTVLANVTASSASPTAVGLPSCSGTGSALDYTTSSGFSCNTAVNAARLNSATFAAPGPIGGTTPGTAAFTSQNIAYATTYAPGVRAPLFIWQNPTGTVAAGTNAGQQIWIGNNPTATPAANDTVAQTIAVTNGNYRADLWATNSVVGICGTAEGCSTGDYLNAPVQGHEIDVYGSASYTPLNRAFNATAGTYVINGQEIYCQGPQYCTSALSVWSTATNGSNWWQEGLVMNRVQAIGLHFTNTAGDTGTQFGTAAIQDDSNSANVIGVGTGTHTNYFNAPNLKISTVGNTITGGGSETIGAHNYNVIGGASGVSAVELQSGSTTGMYCATDASTYGECFTHGSESLLLGSNNTAQLTLTTTSVTAAQPFTASAGIEGVTNGSTAGSGIVGQPVTNTATVSLASGSAANVTSVSLAAGDWLVYGTTEFQPASGTTSVMITSLNTTSATNQAAPNRAILQSAAGYPGNDSMNAPVQILHLSSTTTVYLVANATFTATESAQGVISALRFR